MADPSLNEPTQQASNTFDIYINDNNDVIYSDNPDETVADLKTTIAQNWEVIDCQQLQVQHLQQELEFKANKKELQELSAQLNTTVNQEPFWGWPDRKSCPHKSEDTGKSTTHMSYYNKTESTSETNKCYWSSDY